MSGLLAVPIINYHKISEESDIGITSRRPVDFRNDLRWLRDNGFTSLTFETLDPVAVLPQKPVIITFDDGYRSVLENAAPALAEFGFRAVIYMPVSYIGCWNDWDVQFGGRKFKHLTRDELLILISAGHEIGSHGLSHRLLRHLAADEKQKEIGLSKVRLEDMIGRKVDSFSYPFGRADQLSIDLVRDSGYKFAVSGLFWGRNEAGPFNLPRTNIYRMDSQSALRKKMDRPMRREGLILRDFLIQKGGLATAWYQKIMGIGRP
jgi:peptidoglycan/xylan/chitin deacetylase (PgdA/CDA1 family)